MKKFEEMMNKWKILPEKSEEGTYDESVFLQRLIDAGRDRCVAVAKHYLIHYDYSKKQRDRYIAVLKREDAAWLVVELQRKHDIEPSRILKTLNHLGEDEESEAQRGQSDRCRCQLEQAGHVQGLDHLHPRVQWHQAQSRQPRKLKLNKRRQILTRR